MTTASTGDTAFTGSVPELYERLLVPMIFAEPARALAATIAADDPSDVLETAAGTGALTRELEGAGEMNIAATDLNGAMVQKAEALGFGERVHWQVADALDLPFPDGSFDAVACQFGVMFFPDKVLGYAEARRVLRPGGLFAFNVWDRIEANGVANVVTEALHASAPDGSLAFLRRTPHGHSDEVRIRADLAAAGFDDVQIEHLDGTSRCTAQDGAVAYCQGTPLRGEIEANPAISLDEATAIAVDALERRFGEGAFEAPTRWLQVTARRHLG
ncbi:MAG TPA: class I SAM-dependent methyltransferase [Aeromicrobium sp.]|nr:class I SAM-dependent methyltransferase [Aeromicrobium sp.]